jgi:dCMP deaminase
MSDKLDKDIYYMTLAFNVSRRSIDPSTKHGAVIVSKDGRILSTGYNGPIKQVEDTKVPTTRPEKYKHFLHAEENSVINYYGSAQDIDGATIYITGLPCPNCVRMCLQNYYISICTYNVKDA